MREQRSYSSEGIILKHSDLGEADRVLTLFTPYKGKYRVIGKGIRKVLSKKAGHLELLCESQLQLAMGRTFDIVTQAQVKESFPFLRSELWHMTCGFYLAELIDRFVEDETQQTDVYKLLLNALRVLDQDASALQQQRAQGESPSVHEHDYTRLLLRYFEIHLLTCIGYEPVLRQCAHCNAELLPQENGFNPALGGALCPDCRRFWTQALSLNALKVLRLLQRSEWPQVPRFRLGERLQSEVEAAMYSLLRYHLERDLKSWSFLEMVQNPPRKRIG